MLRFIEKVYFINYRKILMQNKFFNKKQGFEEAYTQRLRGKSSWLEAFSTEISLA